MGAPSLFPSVFLLVLISLILLLKLAHTLLWLPRKLELHFRRQGIGGPQYRVLFGNSREMKEMGKAALSKPMGFVSHDIVHRVDPSYHAWSATYGAKAKAPFVFWFGTKARLVVAEPEAIKEVMLNSGGGFQRMKQNPLTKHLLGDGLFRLEGVKWARHRKIVSPAFNTNRAKGWVPPIVSSTARMLNKWEKESGSKPEFQVEVHRELHEFTGEVIANVAFGSSYEEGKRIVKLQEEQVLLVSQALRQVYIPGFRFMPTKNNRRLWKLDQEIRVLLQKFVSLNSKESENSSNLLGMMLTANKNESEGERIEAQEILDECKAFYFAGQETSANFLTWAIILLAYHQDWQSKAREEVINTCGHRNSPKSDDLHDLKLVSMILYETLRLYPPVVNLTRQACKNIKLGSIDIPAGTQIHIPTLAVHRDPEIWGKDAHEFNPLRVSDLKRYNTSFLAFGLGVRTCVGQNVAMTEGKIAVAMILQRFSFALAESYVHAPMQLLTLQPQFGAPIIFRKIYMNNV